MSAPAYSCRKAAELLSKKLDEPLGPHERFQLGLHLFLCRSCRHAKHQFEEIRSLTGGFLSGAFDADDVQSPQGSDATGRSPGNGRR
jgi:hypothetical protein